MSSQHRLFAALAIMAIGASLATATDSPPGHLLSITREPESVRLAWPGGAGPWFVETSDDILSWSTQGDLVATPGLRLASYRGRAFYRLNNVNPRDQFAGLYGVLQTDQGEFGELMARHRLKARWWVYLPKGEVSSVPAAFFRQLMVCQQFVEEGRVVALCGPLESLATIATPGNAKRLTATWTRGVGVSARSFLLTLDFPYPVNSPLGSTPLLSDPTYSLKCTYATAQPTLNVFNQTMGTTTTDTAALVELAPSSGTTMPWLDRDFTVVDRGVRVSLRFREGLPLVQGSPPFIFKTYLLDAWQAPTSVSGAGLPTFSTDSYFARTVLPGHHNFFHTFLLDPALDPALGEESRAALRAANVRYLYAFHDNATGTGPDDIRYVGFNGQLHDP